MEQLNRIEIRGTVGSVRTQEIHDRKVARISVVTNYVYKNQTGEPVIESTWHSVTAWNGKEIADVDKLERGSKVYVCGRLRSQKYKDSDGVDRTGYDVLANKLTIYDDIASMQYQML